MESKIKYITTRDLKNSKGDIKGKVRVLVMKNQTNALVKYTCPECLYTSKMEKEWKRPFHFKCEKCGFLIRVPRLKEEIKKERKAS